MDLVDLIHTRCPFSTLDSESGFTVTQLAWAGGWLAWASGCNNPYYPASPLFQAWDRGTRDRERAERPDMRQPAIAAMGGSHG